MNRTIAACAAACLLAGPALAQTGPDRVSILLGSEHVNATGFEEVNPGLFLTWTEALFDNRVDVSVGAFRNSYGDGSVAVSLARPLIREAFWGIDAFAALAWYPDNGQRFEYALGDLVPIVGLQGRVGPTFVQVIPGGGNSIDATISFGLTFSLQD